MNKIIIGTVLACGITLVSRPASAQLAVVDGAAIAQDLQEFVQILTQWNEIIGTAHTSLQAFRDAYAGLKNWQHLGWVDTLQILQMPWLDGIPGIDEIRNVATLTVDRGPGASKVSRTEAIKVILARWMAERAKSRQQ
ncbi:MAG: hypothetical protein ABSB49_22010 [Polyangia bacterium]